MGVKEKVKLGNGVYMKTWLGEYFIQGGEKGFLGRWYLSQSLNDGELPCQDGGEGRKEERKGSSQVSKNRSHLLEESKEGRYS